MKQAIQTAAAIGALMAAMNGQARADLVLSGPDSSDGTYSTAGLSAVATGGDTVSSGGVTGISLWGLLGGANASGSTSPVYGGITTSTPAGDNGKNAILRYYLLATSAGGQQSVVSLGEIDPNFGGTAATPAFIAFQNTGSTLLTAPDLIVPGAPGRDHTNVTNLQLLSVPALPAIPISPGGQSASVTLSGRVTNPNVYTAAGLQNDFTPVTESVSGDSYTGVPLWTFLNPSDSNITNQIVVTQATDGYEVVLSLAELDPALGGNSNDLLPYADTNGNFPADGVARTIFPTDNAHGRWESNLDAIVVETVPEPGPFSLLLLATIATGAVRWRWSRRAVGVQSSPAVRLDGKRHCLPPSSHGERTV